MQIVEAKLQFPRKVAISLRPFAQFIASESAKSNCLENHQKFCKNYIKATLRCRLLRIYRTPGLDRRALRHRGSPITCRHSPPATHSPPRYSTNYQFKRFFVSIYYIFLNFSAREIPTKSRAREVPTKSRAREIPTCFL